MTLDMNPITRKSRRDVVAARRGDLLKFLESLAAHEATIRSEALADARLAQSVVAWMDYTGSVISFGGGPRVRGGA